MSDTEEAHEFTQIFGNGNAGLALIAALAKLHSANSTIERLERLAEKAYNEGYQAGLRAAVIATSKNHNQ